MKRYNGFRTLTSSIHLFTAASERKPILVFQDDELIGSGIIDEIKKNVTHGEITEDIIIIQGERYLRGSCTFVYPMEIKR
ncbi:hypothetical protein [Paenibacillus harenae]|uniref:hypothetical protein n=1 Tax=Paenibacillus harenae TaxID=306543 RepID=UPI000421FBF7|nr:hypothetical protein [Paenibacillus harenae]